MWVFGFCGVLWGVVCGGRGVGEGTGVGLV
jgi:hypothetical protein